jgi:glucose/arabinose dehydrogenase
LTRLMPLWSSAGVLLTAATLAACSTDRTPSSSGAGSPGAGSPGAGGASGGGNHGGGSGAPTDQAGAAGAAAPSALCPRGKSVAGATPQAGFCVREFAAVVEPRTLVIAPNGDVFVGAPSGATPGGAANGPGQILLLSDDNQDGVAEVHVFADHVPNVHGLALGGGYLYFTDATTVYRTAYVDGQRAETGVREDLMLPGNYGHGRWTHGLARSVGGALLTSSGEYSTCGNPLTGYISQVTVGSATLVASGFRNPMYLRCHFKDELCAANELGEDQVTGAFEKFIMIRPNTNYGYPCCFTTNKPMASGGVSDCQAVVPEEASFTLGNTPFGFDWERGTWPAPYTGGVFVALHGSAYSTPSWEGAKIVFAPADPTTHLPMKDSWQEFVGGFGPGGGPLERPADIAFAPDGRMFFADDQGNHVYWVAPESLTAP